MKTKLLDIYPVAINMEVKLTCCYIKVHLYPHFKSTTQAVTRGFSSNETDIYAC